VSLQLFGTDTVTKENVSHNNSISSTLFLLGGFYMANPLSQTIYSILLRTVDESGHVTKFIELRITCHI
jgi:hypothetical protein